MSGRGHLSTERPLPAAAELDRLSTPQALDVLLGEDAGVAGAVAAARDEIARVAELAAERLRAGGRLIYVGAGTSGRLAALDAAECPPTFGSDPRQVQAVVAGGERALVRASEGAEDDGDAARAALAARGVGPRDLVLAIAAGGTTPFAHAALAEARARGAATAFLACVPREEAPDEADVSIRVVTGPEVVRGSTRLKAGTATKLVLNAISTLAMVRLGKVHGDRMVDLHATGSTKLHERAVRLLRELTYLDEPAAAELLRRAGGHVKSAAVMHRHGLDAAAARAHLDRCEGSLRRALDALS